MKKNTPSKISNPQSLRALIVEDSEDDALLIIRDLKKGGYNAVYKRVETADAMKKALNEMQWDIILCDYKMPKFNAPSAIAVLKEANIDIPLIIVSGTIGEDLAVECMRLGAQDYIMKGNLSRLCPAVARELEETEVRNKQRQAEKALRESEEKYRTILENIQEGYFEVDLAGNYTFINDSMYRIHGYPKKELMGMNNRQYTEKDVAKKVFKAFNEVYKTGKPLKHIDWQIIRKYGAKRYIEASVSLRKDSLGKPIGFRGIIRDITDRKWAESQREAALEELRLSEENFRRSLEDSPLGVRIVTAEGETIYTNRATLDIYGYDSIEELKGTPLKNRYTPGSYAEFLIRREKRRQNIEVLSEYEISIVRKDGEVRHLQVFRKKILWDGEKQFQVLYNNITTRKQAEDALQESERKYRNLYHYAQVGLFETSMEEAKIIACNQCYCDLAGFPNVESAIGMDLLQLYVNPDDREEVKKVLRTQGYTTNHLLQLKNRLTGKIFWVEFSARVNPSRNIIEGSLIDVTERKRMDEELYVSEERFRLLSEATFEALVIHEEGILLTANDQYLKMFGYEPGEALGKEMISLTIAPEVLEFVKKQIETGSLGPYESIGLRKDGTRFPMELRARKMEYKGRIVRFGAIRDITDRKQAEEQLHASLQEKELLLREVHHRVKNNMQVISGLLALQARSTGNPELTGMLNESQSRIHAMSLVHEKLYGSKDFARIDLAGYVRTISQDLFQSYKINPGKIYLIIQTDGDVYVDIIKAIPCSLILNELISNALKHAFPEDRHGELQIIIRETKNAEIEIVVRDNGLGLPDDIDILQPLSVGLHLVNGLVKNQLYGQIEVRRDNGTEFRIKFSL